MLRCLVALFFAVLPALAAAQDRPNTMIVLDGSGSMWGQIDGVNKIVIARDVLGTILDDFPANENLGLTVYGHRTRGECTDIETIVPSGPGTVDAIRDAANAINPRGKTPMTDAIIAAAQALRYTEERATVVLVSDGIETCNPDPCAAATALEEAGIDFTAHVVGFDVTDPEALAQMQCLASNTGGTFTTASNADELTEALATVTAPEPQLASLSATARIRLDDTNTRSAEGTVWTLTDETGAQIGDMEQGERFDATDLALGTYTITALWPEGEVTKDATATLAEVGGVTTIEIIFDRPVPKATLEAPATAPAASELSVAFTGPMNAGDLIALAAPGSGARDYVVQAYVEDGSPVMLELPLQDGDYELRYREQGSDLILATRALTVTPIEIALDAPNSVPAGNPFQVIWTGPDAGGDNVQVGPPGEGGYDSYAYTQGTNPLQMTAPATPGTYELRYVWKDREVAATRPLVVTEAALSLTFPAEVSGGETFDVTWQGPNAGGDNVQIGPVGDGSYSNYAYVTDGNPVRLVAPMEPGSYEVRYVFRDRETILTQPITVTPAVVSLTFPAEVPAGSSFDVTWQGPDAGGDNVQIGPVGEGSYTDYAYVSGTNPITLRAPIEAGAYEVRYKFRDRDVVLALPITVTPVTISLSYPDKVQAGTAFMVNWAGPGGPTDTIQIGTSDGGYSDWAYTSEGNPLEIIAPDTPGTYEMRYHPNDGAPALTQTIKVSP